MPYNRCHLNISSAQVDHLTELLERSTADTQQLLSALVNISGANRDGGDAVRGEPNAGSRSTVGGRTGHGVGGTTPAASRAANTSSSESSGSSTSHPTGWFCGKLPSFGTCGGKRGRLSAIWQVWGGAGPGQVTGGESGFSLRAHGETSIKEQEVWGSTSNYGRYLQAGRYMDSKIASVKVNAGEFTIWHRTFPCVTVVAFGAAWYSLGSSLLVK